jgi:rhodanese-related sulfurtransferase
MNEPSRIDARSLDRRLRSGLDTLLVCAYEGDVGSRKFPLAGAISLADLRARLDDLPRDVEIVFYCRCPNDKTALERAQEFHELGWSNAKVLAGGFEAASGR